MKEQIPQPLKVMVNKSEHVNLHCLKISPCFLGALIDGRKKCEIRLNDRDYQKGDILQFIDEVEKQFKSSYQFEITHVHTGLGVKKGYCLLSVAAVKNAE